LRADARARTHGYHRFMNPVTSAQSTLHRWGRAARASWDAWWHTLLVGAQILVLALSPTSYSAGTHRRAVFESLYRATAPLLTWFLTLSALVSLVLIRIVVATATSYGLSQYALEVLVRTLVLELIPLYAALFVAVRYAMPGAQAVRKQLALQQRAGRLPERQMLLVNELLPRALGCVFSVLLLAGLSSLVALILTYLTVYGFSPWGLPGYTHAVGGVFTPAVSLIFSLKTLFFSLAVAVVPLAASAQPDALGNYTRRSDMSEFARLFSVVLLIEVVSLVGNYY
jgi:phospholipid/cholesterol/gamma-HCH transport system permease protein